MHSPWILAASVACLAACVGAIGDAGDPPPTEQPPVATRSDKGLRLPRLGHLQWARTAQTFLRLPETPKVALRADVAPDGAFETDDRGRSIDDALVRDYRAAADALADGVVDDPASLARFVGDDHELASIVEHAFARAYRRPLGAEEIAHYVAIGTSAPGYAEQTDEAGRLREALRVLIRVALQSPHFVYRVELGDPATEHEEGSVRVRMLTPREYATRVSYALFDAPPDDALLAADLGDDAVLQALVDDERAEPVLLRFHVALYGVDASRAMRKDATKFPGMEGLGADAANEAERFLDDVVRSGGGLRELLLSRKTFVNRRLASIYELPSDGLDDTSFLPRELPSERAGILTRVSWTASEADLVERSSILRGVFVTRKVLCTPLGNPPPGAGAMAPTPPTSLTTNRERVTFKTSAPLCKSCHHTIINPTGFAFEAFDAIGKHLGEEGGKPIDASGTLEIDGAPVSFDGARGFLEAAAESEQAHGCYAGNLASWLLGRPVSAFDRENLARTIERSKTERASVRALVKSLIASASFRSLVVEEP